MHRTIVMGPEANVSKGVSPFDSPVFDPAADLQEWRRNISRWVDTIRHAAEKGQDRMYKTVYATLANQLYDRGLPSEQKSIIDEAQLKGLINYKQEDQIAAVRDIIELIAIDSPVATVSRLIDSFHRVTNCRRRRNEDLRAFVPRFRGLAADHLMHGGLSSSSQVGEVLAITLLNNANLSEETLTNAKLQLIALAKEREDAQTNMKSKSDVSVSEDVVEEVDDLLELVRELQESRLVKTFKTDSVEKVRSRIHSLRHGITSIVSKLEGIQKSLKDSKTKTLREEGTKLFRTAPRCRLNLDDAVSVLRNLSFSPSKDAPTYTKAQLDNMVNQRVQKALLAFTQKDSHTQGQKSNDANSKKGRRHKNQNRQNQQGRSSTPIPTKSGKRPRCYDCGSSDHVRGDDECKSPAFWTKKLRSEGFYDRKEPTSGRSKNTNSPEDPTMANADFAQGSGPLKRNHH